MIGLRAEQRTEIPATPCLSRRRALSAGGAGLATAIAARLGPAAAHQATPTAAFDATPETQAIPMTGEAVLDLAGFDHDVDHRAVAGVRLRP